MDQIIIKQSYFDNIKTAVDGINKFFESGFQEKNFPTDTENLDWAVANVIKLLDTLDPNYVSDNKRLDETIDMISDKINENSEASNAEIMSNRTTRNAIESIISFTALNEIADNFQSFSKFINGIYTFELYLKPSQYRDVIDKFTANLQLPGDLEDLDLETSIFDVQQYVSNLFNNPDITFPDTVDQDKEVQRILEYRDVENTEVMVNDKPLDPQAMNQTPQVQESYYYEAQMDETFAEETDKRKVEAHWSISKNIRYDKASKRYQISGQLKSFTDDFVSNIRKCRDVGELKSYLSKFKFQIKYMDFALPYIVVQAITKRLDDPQFADQKLAKQNVFDPKKKNKSAVRFAKYSIYDTFKTDKEGTVKFIEDFLTLDLVNNPKATISNNVVLALFNIFDSRMYLSTVFDSGVNPSNADLKNREKRRQNTADRESFIATVRGRLNRNSHSSNVYQKSATDTIGKSLNTKDIQESINIRLKSYGDITLEEMSICEGYKQILHDEISTIGDVAYNNCISPSEISDFIGESYVFMERDWYKHRPAAKGEIPDYMLSRMDLSDGEKEEEPTMVEDPLQEPDNSVYDLADSIDEKMDSDGPIDDLIGSKFKEKGSEQGKIVYNVTYNNSFNKTSNDMSSNVNSRNTTNDSSSGKTSTRTTNNGSNNTTNDLSEGKNITNTNTNTNTNSMNSTNSNNSKNSNNQSTNSNNRTKSNSHSNNTTKTNTNSHNTHSVDERDSHDTITDSHNNFSNSYNKYQGKSKIEDDDSIGIEDDIDEKDDNIDTEIEKDFNENNPGGKNNNDNSNDSLDSKDVVEYVYNPYDRKLSNGMTVGELFTFLESEEPLSNDEVTVDTRRKAPRSDSLTRAMDRDRESMSRRQEAKKRLQKFGNTTRAALRPITRTKRWLTNVVNSLVERDENKVKEEIIENPSYRTSLYKALRLAVKLGLTGIAFTISGWLGLAVGTYEVARFADKNRLRREVQDEMVTELKIMDKKIDDAEEKGDQKELYKLMRLRGKMEGIAADASRGRWKDVKPGRRTWY